MIRNAFTVAMLAACTVMVSVDPALAQIDDVQELPAPGILGLVAMEVER